MLAYYLLSDYSESVKTINLGLNPKFDLNPYVASTERTFRVV